MQEADFVLEYFTRPEVAAVLEKDTVKAVFTDADNLVEAVEAGVTVQDKKAAYLASPVSRFIEALDNPNLPLETLTPQYSRKNNSRA